MKSMETDSVNDAIYEDSYSERCHLIYLIPGIKKRSHSAEVRTSAISNH